MNQKKFQNQELNKEDHKNIKRAARATRVGVVLAGAGAVATAAIKNRKQVASIAKVVISVVLRR